ncbi:hypothetical protein NC651_007077 [Populus alba x Populus x berolinensis]|nr:hypothetical protein NC651_007077 [Populus alba x Populus x berolinensis]
MRRRTALPIPGNLCGNFGTTSIAQFIPGDDSTLQLHDLVNRINEGMSSTFSECAKASNGDDIISIVTNKMLKMKEIFDTTEIDVYLFNSWSRFPIYEADFGWERLECWWEKPLVVALKHSEGIKHTVLLQRIEALQLINTTKA